MRRLMKWLPMVLLAGCLNPPAHIVLRVEDPLALAGDAVRLEIGSNPARLTRVSMEGESFPVTVTLTGPAGGRTLTMGVYAMANDDSVLASASFEALFPEDGETGNVTVELSAACNPTTLGEPCALEDAPDVPGICATDGCVPSRCGDGVIDSRTAEQCDDGNEIITDSCPDGDEGNCQNASCGDGYLWAGEEVCDDGNLANEDFCTAACEVNVCGDSFRNPATEACDDGNDSDEDACLVGCVRNTCGDGAVNRDPATLGGPIEECDDANENPNDGCDSCSFTRWTATLRVGYGDNLGFPTLTAGDPTSLVLNSVGGLAVDERFDILYVADAGANRIWRVDPATGTLAIAAGLTAVGAASVGSGDGGPAALAVLDDPYGLAVDGSGVLYITEVDAHRVRKVDPSTGIITRVAGTGTADIPEDYVSALVATLDQPHGVAVDASGNVFIADTGNGVVRQIDADGEFVGQIHTVAGSGTCGVPGKVEVPATSAPLCQPWALAIGPDGKLYIADAAAHMILRLEGTNLVRIAGTGTPGSSPGPTDAPDANITSPVALTFASNGDLYFASFGSYWVQRVIAQGGEIIYDDDDPGTSEDPSDLETLAGKGAELSPDREGAGDGGPAIDAGFQSLAGLALTSDGSLYVSDVGTGVRVITPAGAELATSDIITGFAGRPASATLSARNAEELPLEVPAGVAYDTAGNLYVVDQALQRVFKVAADGDVDIVAGSGGFTVASGWFGGDGNLAIAARLNQPHDVAVDASGNLFIADTGNHRIRRVDATTGLISTYAGKPLVDSEDPSIIGQLRLDAGRYRSCGSDVDCPYNFTCPAGECIPPTEYGSFFGDGSPANQADLDLPTAVEVASNGDVYFVDYDNNLIRKVDTGGIISTVAGILDDIVYSGPSGADATAMAIGRVGDIALDADDNLYLVCWLDDAGSDRFVVYTVDTTSGAMDTVFELTPDFPSSKVVAGITVLPLGDILVTTGSRRPKSIRAINPEDPRCPGSSICPTEQIWAFPNPSDPSIPYRLAGHYAFGALMGDGNDVGRAFFQSAGHLASNTVGDWVMAEAGGIKRVRKADAATNLMSSAVGWLWPGDGDFSYATLGSPRGLVWSDELRAWMIADAIGIPIAAPNAGAIRRVSLPDGKLDTVAGYLLGANDLFPIGPPRFGRGLKETGGISIDEAGARLFVSEPGFNTIYALEMGSDPQVIDAWQWVPLSGEGDRTGKYNDGTLSEAFYDTPGGLFFFVDGSGDEIVLLADTGNHVIREINLTDDLVTTPIGTPGQPGSGGDGGLASAAELDAPEAIMVSPVDGSIYIADTGNHRVRRVASDGTITTVLGTGEPKATGDGEPASSLPVQTPRGLSFDLFGNLYVTSTTTVRVVAAGADGVADGSDSVTTIFGAPPRVGIPEEVSNCLTGIEVDPTLPDSSRLFLLDGCQGYFIELVREPPRPVEPT